IVIAHTAHPGTAELVGSALMEAAKSTGMPEGVFSLLFSSGYEIGQALVRHPAVKAVGFTGSRRGGRALMDIAAARAEPIPVYTEMSSVNPTFFLPGAIQQRGESLVTGLHASVTGGAGQFCTQPGLVFLPESDGTVDFVSQFKTQIAETVSSPLLTGGIQKTYNDASARREGEV